MDITVAKRKGGKEYNRFNEEIFFCKICRKRKTTMLGTKLCDICYNLESYIEIDPEVAKKILNTIESKRRKELREQYIKEYPETHQQGVITLENMPYSLAKSLAMKGDLGIQIAKNGRVWVCIDGIAFLRFQPTL